jgi:integrase
MGRRVQGSIVRKKQLWYGVADLGRDARGVRCRKWTRGFEKRREAERDLARLISSGTPTLPAHMIVVTLIREYVDHVESQGRQKTTVERYRSLLRSNIEPNLATTRLSTLRGSHLNEFYAALREKGLSDTTVSHVHGLLTATFRWGRRCGRTDRDPMIGVDPPRRARSNARAMRPDDARAFFAWLPTTGWARWHPLFLFALATGMRRGELLALRRENVDIGRGVVIVAESLAETKGAVYRKATKTEHIREIPLSALAVKALGLADRVRALDREHAEEAYEDHDLVFAGPAGCRIRPMTVATHEWR